MKTHLSVWFRVYRLPASLFLVVWLLVLVAKSGIGTAAVFPVLNNYSVLGLAALGVGVTIIAGEFDMSVASVAVVASMLAVRLGPLGLVGVLVVTTLIGVMFGALQGYIIARTGIASIVLTIATLILLAGVAYVFTVSALLFNNLAIGIPLLQRYGVFSTSILIALAVFVIVGLFLAFTRPGRELYAIGGDRNEAVAAGVNAKRSVIIAFSISAGCASLAGAMSACMGGSATPDGFSNLLLPAVSAALIGGIALKGGRGTVLNVALGVATLSAMTAGIAIRGESDNVAQLATGALLMFVIAGEWLTKRLAERASIRARRLAAAKST
jgi:ribose transport system permease protein